MIKIDNLTKKFGNVTAVQNICLHVRRGELFCFLGPNGAGKTTIIKILTGLLRPTSGSVRINDVDILSDPDSAKKVIGYIPDMPFLYERLTPSEFFEFTGDLYNIPREKIYDELEKSFRLFGLIEQKDVLIKELSHGMRQRLLYSTVFLHEPMVLFIDEPLVGLDPYAIRLIKNLLTDKARAGMTIFLTTHVLALAEDIADRIGIINKGSLIALGTWQELIDKTGKNDLEDIFLKLTSGDM